MFQENERLNQLYQEWKQQHAKELQEKLGDSEEGRQKTFEFGIRHAMVLELQKIDVSEADKAVNLLKQAELDLTEEEWIHISRYVMSQTYLMEEWEV